MNNGASFSQDAGNALLFRLTAVQLLEMFKEIREAGGKVETDALVAAVRIHDASYDWSDKAPDRILFEQVRGQWLAVDFFNKAKYLGLQLNPPQFGSLNPSKTP